MVQSTDTDRSVQLLLSRLNRGDPSARDELLNRSCDRLRTLTRRLLGGFPSIRRWEQTDDVLQQSLLRLYRSLADVRPHDVPSFMGLAATQIRRTLIDLARRYAGPHGLASNHATAARPSGQSAGDLVAQSADQTSGPVTLHQWTEFHRQVENLPDTERRVFELLYYQGLSQASAAKLLDVSERTIRRHWRSAKLKLHQTMTESAED